MVHPGAARTGELVELGARDGGRKVDAIVQLLHVKRRLHVCAQHLLRAPHRLAHLGGHFHVAQDVRVAVRRLELCRKVAHEEHVHAARPHAGLPRHVLDHELRQVPRGARHVVGAVLNKRGNGVCGRDVVQNDVLRLARKVALDAVLQRRRGVRLHEREDGQARELRGVEQRAPLLRAEVRRHDQHRREARHARVGHRHLVHV